MADAVTSVPVGQIVEVKEGTPTIDFIKWLASLQTAVNPFGAITPTANYVLTADASAVPQWSQIVNANVAAAAAIAFSKLANVSATDKLLGRSSAGAGAIEEIACTAAGRALIDDANAAAQRTTLGLGTLATQNGTFSGTSSGTNTGDQAITLTGDVTGSGTGSFAATIANDAVTYAKIQNVTDARLLGRSAGSAGDTQELTVGTGLALAAGVLSATGVSTYTEGTWTPVLNSFTVTGATTLTGTYTKMGRVVFWTASIQAATALTCVAGTSNITGLNAAIGAAAVATNCDASNFSSAVGYGNGNVDLGPAVWPPSFTAGTNVIKLSGILIV